MKNTNTKYIILIVLIFCKSVCSFSQSRFVVERDSFLTVLKRMPDDSIKALTLIQFGWWWENYNMDSAAVCYIKEGELSKKIRYIEGELKYYANYTFILNHQGKYDKSLELNLESVELAKKKGNKKQLGRCLFNTGSSYNNMTRYNEAIVYYLQATKMFEELNDTNSLAIAYGNIGGVFSNIEQYEKGLEYTLKALREERLVNNKQQEATFLVTAGICASKAKQLIPARKYFKEGISKAIEAKSRLIEMQGYIAFADLCTLQKEFEESISYGKQGLKAAREVGSKYNEMDALQVLTQAYAMKKDPKQTIAYAELGIEFGKKNNITGHLQNFYKSLADAKALTGDFKGGYENLIISHIIEDSVNQKEVTKKIEQLEISFQSAQKEKQILQFQTERKHQNMLIGILIVSIVILFIISFLVYINLRSRKRNSEQKNKLMESELRELHQSQQLLATESVLKGEEEERSRLAKDLHDGLGGMLWGVKSSLSSMKGNLVMQNDQVQIFERSLDMLTNSITELRRVAHNLMPEALVKFGLAAALKDFCDFVNSSKIINVIFQQVGKDRRLDMSIEVVLYRVANELVNNALRHSSARELIIQLNYDDHSLTLTVEDNGVGFDKSILDKTTGSGWPNIKSRIAYLKGILDVETSPGNGTSVNITIPT